MKFEELQKKLRDDIWQQCARKIFSIDRVAVANGNILRVELLTI